MKLQMYTLFWWRIEYTSIGLGVFLIFVRMVYQRMLQPLTGWVHFVLLYLCTAPLLGTFHITYKRQACLS
ncbi:hypothetical protein KNP414_01174 [Paenibacillus mucilaginosus KNP414]|uniref:Uncharacterized protein n=1 Tax=Paenibacillus mucilaginosus (strain KNP414) TaxID=1036673 RepID=F8FF41_PAEMK|nr:hypothetical protein KNP414_01174 [Paenibacillus mucilaginosus KNP414]